MANVLVESTSLQDIADAIRTKNGTQNTYKPSQMADAIENLPSGSSGYTVDDIASRSLSGQITINGSTIGAGAFIQCPNITKISGQNVTSIGDFAFRKCTGVVEVDFPNLTTVGWRAFDSCGSGSGCGVLYLPKLTTFSAGGTVPGASGSCVPFASSNFTSIILPAYTGTTPTYMASGCSLLTGVDLGKASKIDAYNFQKCTLLTTLVLRRSSVTTLANINAFTESPFASGGTGGTVYVPQDLISSYESASVWSTILGYENNQILPIEGSAYENAYVDGTPIP